MYLFILGYSKIVINDNVLFISIKSKYVILKGDIIFFMGI